MGEAPQEIGHRIQQLRLAHGLSQRALAEPRYTAAYVSSVESGKRSPSAEALRHFAQRLGLPDSELTASAPPDGLDLELALVEAFAAAASTTVAGSIADGRGHADATSSAKAKASASAGAGGRSSGEAGSGAEGGSGSGGGGAEGGFGAVARAAEKAGDTRRQAWALLAEDPEAHLATAARLLEGEPVLDRITLVLAQARAAEPRYAIYLLEEFRDALYRDGLPDPDARYAVQVHLAERYLQIGDEERAGESAQAALALAGPAHPAAVAADHLTTARALLALRRPAEAAVALGQAKAGFLRAGFTRALAACHRARGWIRRDAGQLEEAAADLAQARRLYGDTEDALDVGVELAEVQRRRGHPQQADELLFEALQGIAEEGPLPLRVASAYRERGLLALERGDQRSAEAMLRKAASLYRHTGPRRELARSLRTLGDLLCAQDRLAEAADLLRSGLLDLERMD